jgi:hypothetical protein
VDDCEAAHPAVRAADVDAASQLDRAFFSIFFFFFAAIRTPTIASLAAILRLCFSPLCTELLFVTAVDGNVENAGAPVPLFVPVVPGAVPGRVRLSPVPPAAPAPARAATPLATAVVLLLSMLSFARAAAPLATAVVLALLAAALLVAPHGDGQMNEGKTHTDGKNLDRLPEEICWGWSA